MVAQNIPSPTDLLLQSLALGQPSGSLAGTPSATQPVNGNPYGSLDTGSGQFLPTSNAPMPVARPQIGLQALQAANGGGGGVTPSPLPQMANPTTGSIPQQPNSAGSGLRSFAGAYGNTAPTTTASSPFSTTNPNSFMSKLFGVANAGQQQPLVRQNSLVGRVAHLFMDQ